MKTTSKLKVDDILSSHPPMGKTETWGALMVAAWEAKQRGETEITLVMDTSVAPCSCCNPATTFENSRE